MQGLLQASYNTTAKTPTGPILESKDMRVISQEKGKKIVKKGQNI